MDWQEIVKVIWNALNSPAGITTVASLFLWSLNRIYTAKPLWQQYEGAIISGVKLAEKTIGDTVENKGLARLDYALKYVIKIYEEAQGRKATIKQINEFKNGIQIVHSELEANDCLNKR
jgi:hypothetical protein